MDLTGRTIGNYQIVQELGRGGMAVVYRAYQQSLNRYVAIKVLPPQLSFDREFVERFQREARAAAGLRHPNIVVIHDVGHDEGIYYIVMEYLEGRTLRQFIEQEGQVSPKRVSGIVGQIGAALDYAHQQGFVHRDVKPANIFVGEGDRVTLTDFGIAKAASETQQLTRTGMLMGTPEYMSPEQAEGGRVDHRTDLYALGVVLYQMLAGRVPFRGTTPHAVLHAVIYEPPPPPRQLNPRITPALEGVIVKSVAKRPEQRFQTGAEMASALQAAAAGRVPKGAAPPPTARVAPVRQRSPLVWIMGGIALLLVVVLGGLFLLLSGDGGDGPLLPTETRIAQQTATVTSPISKPTDTASAPTEPPPTKPPGAPTDTAVVPTATLPPTNTSVPPTHTSIPPTGTPIPPTDTPPPTNPPAPDAHFGRLAFSSGRNGQPEIFTISLPGGSPVRLTSNNANDWLPDWSLDGSRIAFTSNRTGSYDLWVMSGNGSGQTSWVQTGAWDEYARWAPDGQRISFSSTAKTDGVDNSEIFVRQTNGSLTQVTSSRAENQSADWSPDGRIVYTEGFKRDRDWDIFIINPDGSNRQPWLDADSCDVKPAWSPDGQWIAFVRNTRDINGDGTIDSDDAGDIWVGRASGGGLRQLTAGVWATAPAWSPDSQWVAYTRLVDTSNNGRSDPTERADILAVPAGGGESVPLLQESHRDGDPSWTW